MDFSLVKAFVGFTLTLLVNRCWDLNALHTDTDHIIFTYLMLFTEKLIFVRRCVCCMLVKCDEGRNP